MSLKSRASDPATPATQHHAKMPSNHRRIAISALSPLVLAILCGHLAAAEIDMPRYVATQPGELPIILSAPHGGTAQPPDTVERKGDGLEKGPKGFFTGRDTGTEELCYEVAKAIELKLKKKPYIVAAKFHRRYIDPNRPAEIAFEDPDAKPVYDFYHGSLNRYCRDVQQKYQRGLLLDIHGQGSARDTVFRGTQNGKTVTLLRERFGESAHIGSDSLFGSLKTLGWKVHPLEDGKEQAGFTGGYIVQTYGSHQGFGIDAVQLEFGADYRAEETRKKTAAVLADAVATYKERYIDNALPAKEPEKKKAESKLSQKIAQSDSKKMNVVLVLIDDLGWTDLACYGSDLHETPNIDRLARDGMKFTQAYSACTVCSPTRASLMTGKYPARLHVTDWIPGLAPANPKLLIPDWTKYLPLEETTLAEVFHAAGYATASIGKWHLGEEPHYPQKQGFDINIAGTIKAAPASYFAPYNIPTLSEGSAGEYLTDRLAEEAVKFIEQSRDKPFFLYLPNFAVHLPIQAKLELVEKYRSKYKPGLKHANPAYAAMLESVDQAVGRIRQKLDDLQIADRTAIVFTSDNGGHIPTTSNKPLRVGKASCYEGGTRVPLLVHWPGVTHPGSVSDATVITPDLYPTLLSMTSLDDVPGHRSDGISLIPVLKQSGPLNREAIYWHYPHYQLYQQGGTTPYGAIRAGDWKLIEIFDDMRVELYNIREDIGEQNNLASEQPVRAKELREKLHAWRKEVGAQMPTVNSTYNPAKPEHIPATKAKKAKAA